MPSARRSFNANKIICLPPYALKFVITIYRYLIHQISQIDGDVIITILLVNKTVSTDDECLHEYGR